MRWPVSAQTATPHQGAFRSGTRPASPPSPDTWRGGLQSRCPRFKAGSGWGLGVFRSLVRAPRGQAPPSTRDSVVQRPVSCSEVSRSPSPSRGVSANREARGTHVPASGLTLSLTEAVTGVSQRRRQRWPLRCHREDLRPELDRVSASPLWPGQLPAGPHTPCLQTGGKAAPRAEDAGGTEGLRRVPTSTAPRLPSMVRERWQ